MFFFSLEKLIISHRIGGDEDPQPEQHPCPDFFDTCCSLKKMDNDDPIIPEAGPKVGKPEKCGVRNKMGAVFNLIERRNESQFGK